MNFAILLLGGNGNRLKSELPKQFIKINEKEVFLYSYEIFLNHPNIDKIILITLKEFIPFVKEKVNLEKTIVIEGGLTRQESVFNALKYLKDKINDSDIIIIHDACRPLITTSIITSSINEIKDNDAVITSMEATNSLAIKDGDYLSYYIDRSKVVEIQTPQTFRYKDIYEAHLNAYINKKSYTDDGSILENKFKKVKLIRGNSFNFKITTFEDLILFERIINHEF